MSDCRNLVLECVDGDEAAFARLVSGYQDFAVGYSYSLLGDFHLAQDAAQEAFLQVYRDIAQLAEPAAFPGWFRKIVFKHCDRIRRGKKISTVPIAESPEIVDDNADPADMYLASQTRLDRIAIVTTALQSISDMDRSVLTLFYMGEHSVEEISMFLQISQPAVKKRLQRARERLKERMLKMVGQTLADNAPSHNARFREAGALMRRAQTLLEQDPRVVAAWLADSFGFGDDTGWSSAWLQVVVKDEFIDSFILSAEENVSQIAEPLVKGIGLNCSPVGGIYCAALYDGEAGPYEMNWYWQPLSDAIIPTATSIPGGEFRPVTHVLFNRGNVPSSGEVLHCEYNRTIPLVLQEKYNTQTEEEKFIEALVDEITNFWFMLLISARWVGGIPSESEPRHLEHIWGDLANAQRYLNLEVERPAARLYTGTASKLSTLRETAGMMERLMPIAAERGAVVNPAIVPCTYRFLDLVEQWQ